MKPEKGYREPVELDENELDTEILERTTDPMRAAMLKNILEEEGIVVSTPGYSVATTVGVMGTFDIMVRVPRVDVARARSILRDRGALSSRVTVETPRRWRAALFVALVPGFGLGHVYAGAYMSGACLAIAEILALRSASQGVVGGVFGALIIVLADAWGSRAACERANQKTPVRGWLSPGAIAGPFLMIAYLVTMMTVGPSWVAGSHGRLVCEMRSRCYEADFDACLVHVSNARLDGWHGVGPACEACLEAEPTCGECEDVCDLYL